MSMLQEMDGRANGRMNIVSRDFFFFMLIPSNLNFKVVVSLPCVCNLLPPLLLPEPSSNN